MDDSLFIQCFCLVPDPVFGIEPAECLIVQSFHVNTRIIMLQDSGNLADEVIFQLFIGILYAFVKKLFACPTILPSCVSTAP